MIHFDGNKIVLASGSSPRSPTFPVTNIHKRTNVLDQMHATHQLSVCGLGFGAIASGCLFVRFEQIKLTWTPPLNTAASSWQTLTASHLISQASLLDRNGDTPN